MNSGKNQLCRTLADKYGIESVYFRCISAGNEVKNNVRNELQKKFEIAEHFVLNANSKLFSNYSLTQSTNCKFSSTRIFMSSFNFFQKPPGFYTDFSFYSSGDEKTMVEGNLI